MLHALSDHSHLSLFNNDNFGLVALGNPLIENLDAFRFPIRSLFVIGFTFKFRIRLTSIQCIDNCFVNTFRLDSASSNHILKNASPRHLDESTLNNNHSLSDRCITTILISPIR